MADKKIKIEIDEDVYLKIKDIATTLYPGVTPPPSPNEIVKFLIDNYRKNFLDGASIIRNKGNPI